MPTDQPHNPQQNQLSSGMAYATEKEKFSNRILVVDHDPQVFSFCRQTLEPSGFEVQSLNSHHYIVPLLQQRLFDLILLGLSPTPNNGLDVLGNIRSQTIDLPVVVMAETTQTDSDQMILLEHLSDAVQLGMQGLLIKPFSPDTLHTTVNEVMLKYRHDTSEQWNMIQHLVQTEKLASLGRLVSSIAHEMNNPLQALHSALQLLGKRSLEPQKRQQYQTMAQQEVENLIEVVRRMLDICRPSLEGMRPTNVNALLETVLRMVDDQLTTNKVRVLRDWYPRLPLVAAIGSRLRQLCHHLVANAIEAMPQGGELAIRTYTTNGNGDYRTNLSPNLVRPTRTAGIGVHGPSVVVEVSDTGRGIPVGELPKVFEPFYTTRFDAAGLGLAISHSIVEQHQGQLTISSVEGEGTTVQVRLPALSSSHGAE